MIITFDEILFIETYGILPLKTNSSIVNIVNNSDGTYTIETLDTQGNGTIALENNGAIEIKNTSGFNGIYQIDNVTQTQFDIILIYENNIGLTTINDSIPIPDLSNSTWININPTFLRGRPDLINVMTNEFSTGIETYPRILLLGGKTKRILRSQPGYANLELVDLEFAFMVKRNINWTEDEYRENSFKPMEILLYKFIDALENYNNIKPGSEIKEINVISPIDYTEFYQIILGNDSNESLDSLNSGIVATLSITIDNAIKICSS